jgi:hypothetical protein
MRGLYARKAGFDFSSNPPPGRVERKGMTEVTLRSPTPAADTGPAPPIACERDTAEATYDDVLARLPFPSTSLTHLLAARSPTQEKLDGFMSRTEGPYQVEGQQVRVPSQFRMNRGFNDPNVIVRGEEPSARSSRQTRAAERDGVAAKAGLASSCARASIGRGTPEDVTRVTQALIDANKLEAGSPETLVQRVHNLQWRYGIGLDCAGYVYAALLALHGGPASRLGLSSPDMENFTRLGSNAHFQHVTPERAAAGDVMVLRGGGAEPGHNLIVYSHELLDTGCRARVLATWPEARHFLASSGRIHVLEVDSSFGAGTRGNPSGGVRRDTLLLDEASGQWCTCRATAPPMAIVCEVPYGESSLAGLYRVKGSSAVP